MSDRLKAVLIQPYITSSNRGTSQTEPLGLLCLATYVRSFHDVAIIDLFAEDIDHIDEVDGQFRRGLSDKGKVVELVKAHAPDVIGITCSFTSYCQDTYDIADLMRCYFNDAVIVIGGAHASMDSKNIFERCDSVDIVVRGEGELTFKELLDTIRDHGSLSSVKGITFKDEEGRLQSNPSRDLIDDLDILPIPDRSMIPMTAYLKENSNILPFVKETPVASVMTTRVCPFECVFCSTKVVWERKRRPRSLTLIMEEIEYMVDTYGVREIAFYDDQFVLKKERIIDLCDRLIHNKRHLSLSIPSGVSGWLIDDELLDKMKNAGFYRPGLSIETGNDRTLKFIKKRVNLTSIKEVIRKANRKGFWLYSNFIIGFPFETKEDIEETIRYAIGSGLDFAVFLIAMPHPGAELYEMWRDTGLLSHIEQDSRHSDMETSYYDTVELTATEIQELRDSAEKKILESAVYFLSKASEFLPVLAS